MPISGVDPSRIPRRGGGGGGGRGIHWRSVYRRGAEVVKAYDTGVTLRQMFYRLVSEGLIPNTKSAYGDLSHRTAKLRDDDQFPQLIDQTREVSQQTQYDTPVDAMESLASDYRLDRTTYQEHQVWIGVEKAGLVNQLYSWFGWRGLPVFAAKGYVSQTFARELRERIEKDGRPAILLYAGDFDPSGMEIGTNLVERVGSFEDFRRVALSWEQVVEHGLPPQVGKATDPRAADFQRLHGRLVQVEVDALPPDVLRRLYEDVLADYWDWDRYDAVVVEEERHRDQLWRLRWQLGGDDGLDGHDVRPLDG